MNTLPPNAPRASRERQRAARQALAEAERNPDLRPDAVAVEANPWRAVYSSPRHDALDMAFPLVRQLEDEAASAVAAFDLPSDSALYEAAYHARRRIGDGLAMKAAGVPQDFDPDAKAPELVAEDREHFADTRAPASSRDRWRLIEQAAAHAQANPDEVLTAAAIAANPWNAVFSRHAEPAALQQALNASADLSAQSAADFAATAFMGDNTAGFLAEQAFFHWSNVIEDNAKAKDLGGVGKPRSRRSRGPTL